MGPVMNMNNKEMKRKIKLMFATLCCFAPETLGMNRNEPLTVCRRLRALKARDIERENEASLERRLKYCKTLEERAGMREKIREHHVILRHQMQTLFSPEDIIVHQLYP